MDRRDFFRTAGLGGIAALLPLRKSALADSVFGSVETSLQSALNKAAHDQATCILIPQETEGPYPLNLSADATKFRRNITEGYAGTPLHVKLKVLNLNNNCAPITNARVDVWHCDKDGYYSGYTNSGYLGTRNGTGKTYCRGIQITDAQGEVEFETIYPGWYSGRVQHIHFQVFVNSVLRATSQLAFPETLNTTVNGTALYSAHGQNPTKNTNDNVFSDSANTAYQIATMSPLLSGGYEAELTVGIAVPVTAIERPAPETGGQFRLGLAHPNPFRRLAVIPFWLAETSEVRLDVYDLQGRIVLRLEHQAMQAGNQSFTLDRSGSASALRSGSYAYQLSVRNAYGEYHQAKLLTVE
jgi:protocatechuate 3,4-dioxygenase beta subunit